MNLARHPRTLSRFGGASYVAIVIFAAIAYLKVRSNLYVGTDMARTASNLAAHEELYRLGWASAVIAVLCNLPVGLIFYELFKIVNEGLARALLVFIIAAAIIEGVNLGNYISPLYVFTLPEYHAAFSPAELQALGRMPGKLFAAGFGISLAFFGLYCVLTGILILRSNFLPKVLGLLMVGAGICYEVNTFGSFMALPPVPYILYFTFIAENSLAWWLLIVGVNETKWRAQAQDARDAQTVANRLSTAGGNDHYRVLR